MIVFVDPQHRIYGDLGHSRKAAWHGISSCRGAEVVWNAVWDATFPIKQKVLSFYDS